MRGDYRVARWPYSHAERHRDCVDGDDVGCVRDPAGRDQLAHRDCRGGSAGDGVSCLVDIRRQARQKNRILHFFDPYRDPTGAGYNIIQSQIAIGSGGVQGKGWLNGAQSQLDFIPESNTDFILAVLAEEFGLLGVLFLIALYVAVIGRGFFIALTAQDTFSRLLAGSIVLTFFFYAFVNMAMVSGLMPVVGLPLPLVSKGGTSIVTLMLGFGILMSIQTHKRVLPR